MIAEQAEFQGFPTTHGHEEESLVERLGRLSEEFGPLVPQNLLGSALGVSRQRVHQFLAQGRFTIVDIEGTTFVPIGEIKGFERRPNIGRPKKAA